VAETVVPSVRGYRKLFLTLELIVAGFCSATIVGVLAAVLAAKGRPQSATYLRHDSILLVVSVCALSALVDLLSQRTRYFRPLAAHRQVPRQWGHAHGPWRSAARYGFRMGVGPATILSSWTWWSALVLCASGGLQSSVVGALIFSTFRFVSSTVATLGPSNGLEMAVRSKTLDAFAPAAKRLMIFAPLAIGALCLMHSTLS
jgi:hypothetical protein